MKEGIHTRRAAATTACPGPGQLAAGHALGWLVVANAVGLWLSLLLLFPGWQVGEWTYGRWIPVHLNGQLYGWTALPLVAWLFRIYEVRRRWVEASLWAWTTALALGCVGWLQGGSSGKIFLDWKGGALAGLLVAMGVLWLALLSGRKSALRWCGLGLLAVVPFGMTYASSPGVYPPVDVSTGGPTGSSLLGSTLFVVALMLFLPASVRLKRNAGGSRRAVMAFFASSGVVFGVTEWLGGTHHDAWQMGAMLMLVPWVVLLPKWWRGYDWPEASAVWRRSMFGWWVLLVLSGVTAYFPWVLDRLKFTQGLVAHSHLAMAGFTTSFCALLLTLLGVKVGSTRSIVVWNAAALSMVGVLAVMGWLEGEGYGWMVEQPLWRETGLGVRATCGAVMSGVSVRWFFDLRRTAATTACPEPGQPRLAKEVLA